MSLLIAPDSFKGTFTAANIAVGIDSQGLSAIQMPVADGGEGTLDCLREPLKLSIGQGANPQPVGLPHARPLRG